MNRVVAGVLLVAIVAISAGCAKGEIKPQSGDNVIKFSRPGYEALFTHGNLHEIEIVISQEEWDGMLRDMRSYAAAAQDRRPLTGNYRKATFIYKGPAGDAIIEEVGFRTKGHFNRPYPEDSKGNFHKSHFKIKFNKVFEQVEGTSQWLDRSQRRFCKLRELELRMSTLNASTGDWDKSQIRELYAYDLMRRAGVYTSRTGAARLTITIGGENHYFGIYTLIEPIDKSFLTKRYGSNSNDGNLYKCLWTGYGPASLEPFDKYEDNPFTPSDGKIGVKDWRNHYRPTYDLKTNTDVPDHSVMLDFIHNLDVLSGADLKRYLEANFEIDRFLRYLAMNVLIGKWDDYWADGNNYYLYFNNGGKIEFMPCDYDMALGGGFQLFDAANIGIYDWGNHNKELLRVISPRVPVDVLDKYCNFEYPLAEKVLAIDEYRAKYEHYLKEFIKPSNRLFVYSEYERTFNMLYKVYAPYLDGVTDEGEEMVNDETTRQYFYARTRSIIQQLGLNEEDYELGPVEGSLHAYYYPEGLSFEAKEVRNAEYGFSFNVPADWSNITQTELYEGRAPTKITGLFASVWEAKLGDSLAEVLSNSLQEGSVEIIATGDTVLADGTMAQVAEYKATIYRWPMHCYSIGVKRGSRWITVNLWSIDQYAKFDRGLFEEIAHTLTVEGGVEFEEIAEEEVTEEETAEELPAHEHGEGLLFQAQEITNAEYGFSFKIPSEWSETTRTALFEAVAPSKVTGMFVAFWNAEWGESLADLLIVTMREAPVEIISTGTTALADGTPAEVAEYRATIATYPMHCYSLGVRRGGWWLAVNIWNIDMYANFDIKLFDEIVHTLEFRR
jgi:hypothetical protein